MVENYPATEDILNCIFEINMGIGGNTCKKFFLFFFFFDTETPDSFFCSAKIAFIELFKLCFKLQKSRQSLKCKPLKMLPVGYHYLKKENLMYLNWSYLVYHIFSCKKPFSVERPRSWRYAFFGNVALKKVF